MRISTSYFLNINRVWTHSFNNITQTDLDMVLTNVGLVSSVFDITQVSIMRISTSSFLDVNMVWTHSLSNNTQIDLGKVLTNVESVSSIFDTTQLSIRRISTSSLFCFFFNMNRVQTCSLSLNTQIDVGKVLTNVGLVSSVFDTTHVSIMRISTFSF